MPIPSALVHVLTAFGVVCALLATLAIADRQYEIMFAWLGLAFIIDGVDGPIARYVGVKERLPRFSGERLDLVIDYLTYVFVPVLALLSANFLSGFTGVLLGAAVLLSSLYHFSDTESKADDNSFVGFPAIWNFFAFYVFVFHPPWWLTLLACCGCIALTFVPWHWVHPVRVTAWRGLTLFALGLWLAAAGAAIWSGFPDVPAWAKLILAAVAVYAVTVPHLAGAIATSDPDV